MATTTIAASTVITPEAVLERAEVVVDDGVIAAIRPARGAAPERVLCPGFIDLQVNGHADVAVASAEGADWERLDALVLAQGVTGWCPTLVTAPLASYAGPLSRIAAARSRPRDRARPEILGAHLEGPFLGSATGAHRREHCSPIDLDWLQALPDVVRIVTLAPELPGGLEAIRLLSARGVLVGLGHSTATSDQAEAAAGAGARLVTHLFNAMGPLHHRQPGLAGAALADPRLVPSLIADGVHVHPSMLAATARAKGRGGWVAVTDAVAWRQGDLASAPVTLVDGAPRLADGTLAGSALTLDAAVRRLVSQCGLPLVDVVDAVTATPARLLGLPDRGALRPGARADVVALTPQLDVEEVWVAGMLP